MSTPKYPKPLEFHFRGDRSLVISVRGMGYDKGASSSITVVDKDVIQDRMRYEGEEGCKVTIEKNISLYGLKYEDLIALSKWASKAASWYRYEELRCKDRHTPDLKGSINDEYKKDVKKWLDS